MRKQYEDLDVIDDYMMTALTADAAVGENFSRLLISTLLQRKIGKVRVVAQRMIPGIMKEYRGVRLDVQVEELGDMEGDVVNVYDLEPHLKKEKNIPRCNRFYQAKIDGMHVKKNGGIADTMPNLYVITILNRDLFGKDYMIYTFQNQCKEVPELEYDDGLKFIYFYTGGHLGGNQSIENVLRYLQDSKAVNVKDDTTKQLHEYVTQMKEQPEGRDAYMTWGDYVDELKEEAYEDGEKAGYASGEKAGTDKGLANGLSALVQSLKSLVPDFEQVYEIVIQNEVYANYTKEEVRKYY